MKLPLHVLFLSTALTMKPPFVRAFRVINVHRRAFLVTLNCSRDFSVLNGRCTLHRDWSCIGFGGVGNGSRLISKQRSVPLSTLSALRGGATDSSSLPLVPLPLSFAHKQNDINTAILAVFSSCRATGLLQPTGCLPNESDSLTNSIATVSKKDASPVTVGDFASQAMCLKVLHDQFPSDMYIAEEGSDVLRGDDGLLEKVWDAVKSASFSIERICSWRNEEELLTSIDYGQGIDPSYSDNPAVAPTRRVWCLDPIDGTKGFLRGRIEGGQYCIALALLEDGIPVVSILGCPNQPLSPPDKEKTVYGAWTEEEVRDVGKSFGGNKLSNLFSKRGCMFVAVRGCGCYEVSINDIERFLLSSANTNEGVSWKQLQVTPNEGTIKTPSQATFCLGVERGFSDPKGTVLKIAKLLHGEGALTTIDGVPDIQNSFRMDGQGKYGILARGEAEYFLRLPKEGYRDWVWDVAAGYLILKEAGGLMTDVNGNHIDFSKIGVDRMAKLPEDVSGLLGSCGGIFHDSLVSAYASAESIDQNSLV